MGEHRAPRFGVLYAAESLLGPRTGVGRAALEVARAAAPLLAAGDLSLVAHGRLLPAGFLDAPPESGTAPAESPPGWRAALASFGPARLMFEAMMRRRMRGLARAAGTPGRPVLLHEPNLIPRPYDAGPTVAVVNDVSWRRDPSAHPAERIAWIERNLPRALRQVARWVAISAFTAAEAAAEFGLDRSRIAVVPLAVSPAFRPLPAEAAAPVLAAHGLTDSGYILAVGTLEPRKNLERLAAAHAALPAPLRRRFPLVLAGGIGWGGVEAGPQLSRGIRAGEVRLLGRVSEAELVALYARAAAAAYVSLYEGFGLPVLEAMACGTPLVHSATTAVAEIAGGAGLPVEPADPKAIATGLRRVLEDASLAARLRAAGLARAAEFGWDRTARRMVAIWREAAGT
ncbi:MAG: glycosyltransferase [Acetobacteraceae bacterium]|nr:glycosyltransferase [Acetobacteraceae bacterium]